MLFTNLPDDVVTLPNDEACGLVVADGVGGAAYGDFASRLAVQTLFELIGRATNWVMKITDFECPG